MRLGLGNGILPVAMSGGAVATPETISGYKFALDHRQGVSLDAVTGNVETWADPYGSGLSAAQSTDANQPTQSASGIGFVAASAQWLIVATLNVNSNSHTLVTRVTPVLTGALGIILGGNTTLFDYALITGATNNVGAFDGAGLRSVALATAVEQTLTWQANSAGGTIECFRNGTSLGTAAYDNTGSMTAGIVIGRDASAPQWYASMTLKKLAIYNRVLSTKERQVAETWAGTA